MVESQKPEAKWTEMRENIDKTKIIVEELIELVDLKSIGI